MRWVNIFYRDIQSCIINDGLCFPYFRIKRGDGLLKEDPLSPYHFVTAVKTLAIAIQNEDNIKGIKINYFKTKLLQFTDDTTVVLSDLDSVRALFVLLDCFENVSGLKINVNCQNRLAIWISSLQNCEN